MYTQPAIPIMKPSVALMYPASPKYPPTSITTEPDKRGEVEGEDAGYDN
jgi:hypothetical protein